MIFIFSFAVVYFMYLISSDFKEETLSRYSKILVAANDSDSELR